MLRRHWLKSPLLATALAWLPLQRAAAATTAPPSPGDARGYRQLVTAIRASFPSPVNSASDDDRFSRLTAYALNLYQKLKSSKTFFGKRRALDYASAKKARIATSGQDARSVVRETASYLEGMYTWSHPDVHRLHGSATAVSIIGQLYGSIADPNTVWDDLSHRVAEAEVRVVAMVSDLVGYDAGTASGVFTFGGTGTTFYGIKVGLEKAQPGAFVQGLRHAMHVFASDVAHYAKLSASAWLGLGADAVRVVATRTDNSIDIVALEASMRATLDKGERIATIVVTLGSTDAFGVDDIEAVHALRERLALEYKLPYKPHLHADAVIGWSFCVFNDYDFDRNPLHIPERTTRCLKQIRQRLQSLHLADSIGIDFHKSGYTPYMSSLFLVKDARDLSAIRRDKSLMPYLFQFGEYDPGVYTLECSRSGGPVLAALANLLLLGRNGYRALLGHCVEMSEHLRARVASLPWLSVLNDENQGWVVVLRAYPDGVDVREQSIRERKDPTQRESVRRINELNHRIYAATREMAESGSAPVFVETSRYRLTEYGEPLLGIKCFTLSAYTDEAAIDRVISALTKARLKALVGQDRAVRS